MIRALISQSRSFRRFYQEEQMSTDCLKSLVELATLAPSAANLQPLKYILINTENKNKLVFPSLSWAGYLKEWSGPEEGERPAAYVIMLGDKDLGKSFQCDAGIACQSILLGAVEQGFGGCILGLVNREMLQKTFSIPERYEILYVIALGRPKEQVVLEQVGADDNIKYYRDQSLVHHVPKRAVNDVILDY